MVPKDFYFMLHGAEIFQKSNICHSQLQMCSLMAFLYGRVWSHHSLSTTILYHPDKKNYITVTFSHLPGHEVFPISGRENPPVVCCPHFFHKNDLDISNYPELLRCFLNLSLFDVTVNNSVNFKLIHEQQNIGDKLVTNAVKYPDWYFNKHINRYLIFPILYQMKTASQNGKSP